MPYCPNCKTEYISSITTCPECGSSLVDELPEGMEPDYDAMTDLEHNITAKEEIDRLRDTASTVYVKKADKYEDLRSTAVCFSVLGLLGLIFCILNLAGVLTFYNSPIQLAAMLLVFCIFLIIGIRSYIRSREVKGQIHGEEEMTKTINTWLKEHVTESYLKQLSDPELSDEINYMQQTDQIRETLLKEFPGTEDSYLDRLIDEFFNQK